MMFSESCHAAVSGAAYAFSTNQEISAGAAIFTDSLWFLFGLICPSLLLILSTIITVISRLESVFGAEHCCWSASFLTIKCPKNFSWVIVAREAIYVGLWQGYVKAPDGGHVLCCTFAAATLQCGHWPSQDVLDSFPPLHTCGQVLSDWIWLPKNPR